MIAMRLFHAFIAAAVAVSVVVRPAGAEDAAVTVLDKAMLHHRGSNGPATEHRDGYVSLERGQVAETTAILPPAPESQSEVRRIVAIVEVEPVVVENGDKSSVGDPWTRLGHVVVVLPSEGDDPGSRVEIMRFITGFGGASVFEQDVTALAPLLAGETTFRTEISTWLDPGWSVSLRLEYRDGEAGYRRPRTVEPLFALERFTPEASTRSVEVEIPQGGAMPRMHVFSTGHGGAQEFISATHVLRVDGEEVARWRPWREDGGARHEQNPTSGRWDIDGRELWSSDIDRAGWMPATVVRPYRIPLPELTPGAHTIELEIEGIHQPGSADAADGYWVTSTVVVADEPWPTPESPDADD